MPKPLTPEQEQAKRERTQAKVGLASNALGLTAGTAGLAAAAKNPALRSKFKTTGEKHMNPPRITEEVGGPVTSRLAHKLKTPKAKGRLIAAGAAGAAGLQALNIGGDVVANRVMSRSAAEPEAKVKKSWDGGISKGWDGDDYRVPGEGRNLISKKAYRTRMEREQDRQKRARTESNALMYGAAPASVAGGAGLAAHGVARRNYEQKGIPYGKDKRLKFTRTPASKLPRGAKRIGGGAALVAAAPMMFAGGRRIKEGIEDEWR